MDPSNGAIFVPDFTPHFIFSDDFQRYSPPDEHPADGVALAGAVADIGFFSAERHKSRHRQTAFGVGRGRNHEEAGQQDNEREPNARPNSEAGDDKSVDGAHSTHNGLLVAAVKRLTVQILRHLDHHCKVCAQPLPGQGDPARWRPRLGVLKNALLGPRLSSRLLYCPCASAKQGLWWLCA